MARARFTGYHESDYVLLVSHLFQQHPFRITNSYQSTPSPTNRILPVDNGTSSILRRYDSNPTRLMDMLWDIQRADGHICPKAVEGLASGLNMSPLDIRETISFYHFFQERPFGKHQIHLADTVIARLGAYDEVKAALEDETGCVFGQVDPSGQFGLATTSCIGLSDQEPAMLIDGCAFTRLTADRVRQIISELRAGKTPAQLSNPAGLDSSTLAYVEAMVDSFLPTIGKEGQHGQVFAYREPNIFVLGWIVRRATGRGLSELAPDLIWQHIGAEHDYLFMVDSVGGETTASATLRDFLRFGLLFANQGRVGTKQVLPTRVVDSILAGGDQEVFARGDYNNLPNWSYRSQWWYRHVEGRCCPVARGAHGQMLYIDPERDLVIARFGSSPEAPSSLLDPIIWPLVDMITMQLA